MNRRDFLMLVGGGSIMAASAPLGNYLLTRSPERALRPWRSAGSIYTDPRKRALSYAILAPNPHNRQPWKIDLSQRDTVKILVDTNRLLPHTDPFSRQIIIGFGCFLELLRMAAAEEGYRVSEQLFPEGIDKKKLDTRPIAILEFKKERVVARDPLFTHVLNRRSLKEPYDIRKVVPDKALNSLEQSVNNHVTVSSTNDWQKITHLRELTTNALKLEIDTPHTYKESVDLFRIGKAEIETNPDGIDFSGVLFDTLAAFGQFSRELALDKTSTAYKQGISAVVENTETAMGYIWLATQTNTREEQISAGRAWVRVNLAATSINLGTQPLSQALQEYPEMKSYYEQVHSMLAPNGKTLQMLARLGYGKTVPPSPRWALAEKII